MANHVDLPEDVARRVAKLIAAGRFGSVEEAVRAGVEAIDDLDEEERHAGDAAWSGYLARRPEDPRDLTAVEALACVNSDDPGRRRALDRHLDALVEDMDGGKGTETTPRELMARARARLGNAPAR